ncbi:hypothetical protein [Streptomyces sp. NPDC059787]|uniref:hypothetical protein n=1 Tax=Streptomyces sp. NPDC059787 TaxID=3346947 RepID=UPI003669EB15
MNTSRRAELIMDVLHHAINRDYEQAMEALGEIALASTGQDMYGVCCGIADAARQALARMYDAPASEHLWALASPDPADGPQHPAHAFSLRFIAAYLNGDMETCSALYLAAYRASNDDYSHSLIALISDAAHLARVAAQETAATPDKPTQHPH